MTEQLKIGDTLYIYSHGRKWDKHIVTGETRTSWVLGPLKADKGTMRLRGGVAKRVFTAAEMQEEQWCADHRRAIIRAIEHRADAATLRKIAELLGIE